MAHDDASTAAVVSTAIAQNASSSLRASAGAAILAAATAASAASLSRSPTGTYGWRGRSRGGSSAPKL